MKKIVLLSILSVLLYSAPGYTAKDPKKANKEMERAFEEGGSPVAEKAAAATAKDAEERPPVGEREAKFNITMQGLLTNLEDARERWRSLDAREKAAEKKCVGVNEELEALNNQMESMTKKWEEAREEM